MKRLGVLVAVAVLLGACGGSGTGGTTGGYVGDQGTIQVEPVPSRGEAPILSGTTLDGEELSSGDLEATVLVVNVWGSWCPPCRKEAPVLQELNEQYEDDGVKFLGLVVRDKEASASAFVRKKGLTYPSLMDPGSKLQLGFNDTLPSRAIPTTWVIDREGRVAARILGEVQASTLGALIDDELAR